MFRSPTGRASALRARLGCTRSCGIWRPSAGLSRKCHNRDNLRGRQPRRRYQRCDSDKCFLIRWGNRGIKMRLDTVETRSYQSDVRTSQDQNGQKTLLTPERKAALDALEREFSD